MEIQEKKEVSIDGSTDQNVFDIMAGVSINVFVKTSNKEKKKLGEVYHSGILGKRELKYNNLTEKSLKTISWEKIIPHFPNFFFVPKNFDEINTYENGFKLDDIFLNNNTGIQTKRDSLVYNFSKNNLETVINDILELPNQIITNKYNLPKDGRDWTIDFAKKDLSQKDGVIVEVSYHPFDTRISYFTGRSKGFMAYPRSPLSKNCIKKNISLLAIRNSRIGNINNYFITNKLVDKDGISPLDNCKFFPLYLYPEATTQQSLLDEVVRTPNLNMEIVNKMANDLGMFFSPEKPDYNTQTVETNQLFPIDILDYIYAVLHSPSYREKYKEFLKIDFPRVPYPKNQRQLIDLVDLGSQLRQIHLLESKVLDKLITQYPEDGDNIVIKPRYEQRNYVVEENIISHNDTPEPIGRVYINELQYFDNVPEVAWNFYIGGYQPAQKWLKDRKDRELSYEDILHYQKIIVALHETDRLMKEIDKIEI